MTLFFKFDEKQTIRAVVYKFSIEILIQNIFELFVNINFIRNVQVELDYFFLSSNDD